MCHKAIDSREMAFEEKVTLNQQHMLLLCIDRSSCTTTPFHVCLFRASGERTEKGNNLPSTQDKRVDRAQRPHERLNVLHSPLSVIDYSVMSRIRIPCCAMEQTLIICISWAELKLGTSPLWKKKKKKKSLCKNTTD